MKKHALLLTAVLCAGCAPKYQLSQPPARWTKERAPEHFSMPREREETTIWDAVDSQYFYQIGRVATLGERFTNFPATLGISSGQEALNVNNFDEVADSTWFTNRIGRQIPTEKELRGGPRQSTGPRFDQTMTVLSAKTLGLTPGFLIKDADGNLYLIKFDTLGSEELASGVEIIGTLIFHTLGFNVPENYIGELDPKKLTLSPKAKSKNNLGEKVPFTTEHLKQLFNKVKAKKDGKFRVLASKFLSGRPVGPYPYRGVRISDPNDRIPHEHRRELRGYRVFCAFLDHTDSREASTLDMFIKGKDGLGFIKHHLIDFGSIMGSAGGRGPRLKNHLYDYRLNHARVVASTLAFGFYTPPWDAATTFSDPAVGQFESALFDPQRWRPMYPNPAFQNMTDRDAFWATKLVMKLSDEMLATIVNEAHFSSKDVSNYTLKTLIERRNKIGQHWFNKMSPFDDFSLQMTDDGYVLKFEDLAVSSGLVAGGDRRYKIELVSTKSEPGFANETSFLLTRQYLERTEQIVLRLSLVDDHSHLPAPVDVIILGGKQPRIQGLRRHS